MNDNDTFTTSTTSTIGIIGLGYVGLPLATAFAGSGVRIDIL